MDTITYNENKIADNENKIVETKKEVIAKFESEISVLQDNVLLKTIPFLSNNFFSKNLEDYFTNDGFTDLLKDKILGLAIKKALRGDVVGESHGLKLYNDIEKARQKFLALEKSKASSSFASQLAELRQVFELDESYYAPDEDREGDDMDIDLTKWTQEEYDDAESRERVFSAIKEVIDINDKTPIAYKMGSRFIKPPKPKVDCSGLVSDILRRAGFSVGDQTSRSLFTKFNAKKLSDISNQSVDSQNFSKIQPGDLIYWDATNPSYNWKSSKIPIINVGGQKHRIHHVAIITEKLSNGNLRILESSGTKGVVERELDPKVEFSTKSKSELYVSHMRYDALPVKKEALA